MMKIGSLVGGMLPLLLLVACGGGGGSEAKAPGGKAANEKSKSSAPADAGAANKQASDKTQAPKTQAPKTQAPKTQAPKTKKKRIRRPRIDSRQVKLMLGNEPPGAPKPPVASTPALVALGKTLYHREGLSQNGNLSCASCHNLATYGVDNKKVSPGSTGEDGERNTPTVYNSARQFRQFWDGRAESVEEQVINTVEHGLADEAAVVAKIQEQADLVAAFKKAFPDDASPVTAKNFGIAIGAFERTLVTRSKWDDYIEGNQKALSNEELLGLKTFMEVGCTTCHINRTLGGHAYQKLGLLVPYKGKDTGRMQVTKSEADKYSFKIPMLLNVEKTAPYYHDGSKATLEEAVKSMASEQIGKKLKDEEVAQIVTFLKTLTGPIPEEFANK